MHPKICLFGKKDVILKSEVNAPIFETTELDVVCFENDFNLNKILTEHSPDLIVTFGDINLFPNLLASPTIIKDKWIVLKEDEDLAEAGKKSFLSYLYMLLKQKNSAPLISIFTPAFNNFFSIRRAFNSVRTQQYTNWEWVIFDDSTNEDVFRELQKIASEDFRVKVFKGHKHSGIIGEVKNLACSLCDGDILVELDHDDVLTENALLDIKEAFDANPDCSFAYSNFAECFDTGENFTYPEGWAFGYGKYEKQMYEGKELLVAQAPNINPKTIRHICSAPNHVRAWRKDFYWSTGGHNKKMHVVDDYELVLKCFLNTTFLKIGKLCYIQFRHNSNTQTQTNAEIQRLTRYISSIYDKAIHQRFVQLGIDDYIWNERENSFLKLPFVKAINEQISNKIF